MDLLYLQEYADFNVNGSLNKADWYFEYETG